MYLEEDLDELLVYEQSYNPLYSLGGSPQEVKGNKEIKVKGPIMLS